MSVCYSSIHQAQLIIDRSNAFNTNATESELASLFQELDNQVEASIKAYPNVRIDKDYKRYGLDLGLVSESAEDLKNAAEKIMQWVYKQEHLHPNEKPSPEPTWGPSNDDNLNTSLLLHYDANTDTETVIMTFTKHTEEQAKPLLEQYRKAADSPDFYRLASITSI